MLNVMSNRKSVIVSVDICPAEISAVVYRVSNDGDNNDVYNGNDWICLNMDLYMKVFMGGLFVRTTTQKVNGLTLSANTCNN